MVVEATEMVILLLGDDVVADEVVPSVVTNVFGYHH